jgi:protein-tyrosine phosphatase
LADLIVDVNYPYNHTSLGEIVVLGNVISVGVPDSETHTELLKSLLPKLFSILEHTPHKKVLFRCYAGVSRSATLAAIYLSRKLKISGEQALELVKVKRLQVCPNNGFLYLLKTEYQV